MSNRFRLLSLFVPTLLATALSAQCALQLQSQGGFGGVDGIVYAAVEWDPDGAGPSGPVIVLGGRFLVAGAIPVANLATFDPATGVWSSLGGGCDDSVFALAVLPNGGLVVGGRFTQAGGVVAPGLASWNGSAWSMLGGGIAGGSTYEAVNALAVMPNGDLIAGGDFVSIAGLTVHHVARWNGTAWSALAGGVAWPGGGGPFGVIPESVTSLAALPNGDLVAGGWFTIAGGLPAIGIARWNGTAWSALGGSVNSAVHAILPMPNGDLIVGGQFGTAGGAPAVGIARWNGASWSSLGSGLRVPNGIGRVHALARMANGDVIATGIFTTAGGAPAANIARWDGVSWSALGSGLAAASPVYLSGQALRVIAGGALLVGGGFVSAGGVPTAGIAMWSGTTWSPLARGWNGAVRAFATRSNGDLIAGGQFTSAGDAPANRVAVWNGSWSPLGSGMDASVNAVTAVANGDIVAGGDFTTAGGVAVNSVARWNGSAWVAMGTGLSGTVNALVTMPNGDVVAGGSFLYAGATPVYRIARWNGSTWTPLGAGFEASYTSSAFAVLALAVMPNGDLIAAGQFAHVGTLSTPFVARWDGVAWSAMGGVGALFGPVESLAVLDTGELAAAGLFMGVQRWNGSVWQPMGAGLSGYGSYSLNALAPLPGGQALLGGYFVGIDGVAVQNFARWNGTSWSALPGADGTILALAPLPSGQIAVGGSFQMLGGAPSPYFAKLVTPCPASAIASGAGCTGSGGLNELAPLDLPWLGGTCRSLATGMPANGLALAIVGFAPTSIPLASILPQGVAGCSQLATLDLLDVLIPSAGRATATLAIPNSSALVGGTFHQQVVPIELNPVGNLVAVTATNALTLTIGAL